MNIFQTMQMYAGKWSVVGSREFTQEEKDLVARAEVVPSQYGLSVCFFMKNGQMGFVPLSNTSSLKEGQQVDLDKAKILTLSRPGDANIERIDI